MRFFIVCCILVSWAAAAVAESPHNAPSQPPAQAPAVAESPCNAPSQPPAQAPAVAESPCNAPSQPPAQAPAVVECPCNAPSQPPAQAPSKSEPADCSTLVYNMMDCLPYIQKGSNDTKPIDSCCSGFKSVVKANAECICVALNSSESLGIYIDMSKAQKLSSFCHVSPNPIDKCKGSHAGSPAKPSPSHGTPPKSPNPPHAAKPPAAPKTHHKAPAPAPSNSGAHAVSATPSFILITLFCLSLYRVLA